MHRRPGSVLASLVLGTALAVTGLVGAGHAETGAHARADFRDLGYTHSLNRALRSGCHRYVYSYHVQPTTTDWALEIFLIDPRHHQLASNGFISGASAKNAKNYFTICKPSTRTGVFVIKGKLTLRDGNTVTDGYIKPSTFRLCKPPRPGHKACQKAPK